MSIPPPPLEIKTGSIVWLKRDASTLDTGKRNHPVLVLYAPPPPSSASPYRDNATTTTTTTTTIPLLLITSLGSKELSAKFPGPSRGMIARRAKYIPLARSPAAAHPDNGRLIAVRTTRSPSVPLSRQSYVSLGELFWVVREDLEPLIGGTAQIPPDGMEEVMREVRELCSPREVALLEEAKKKQKSAGGRVTTAAAVRSYVPPPAPLPPFPTAWARPAPAPAAARYLPPVRPPPTEHTWLQPIRQSEYSGHSSYRQAGMIESARPYRKEEPTLSIWDVLLAMLWLVVVAGLTGLVGWGVFVAGRAVYLWFLAGENVIRAVFKGLWEFVTSLCHALWEVLKFFAQLLWEIVKFVGLLVWGTAKNIGLAVGHLFGAVFGFV